MATITENLKTIVDCKIAIKQAIIDKGGQVGNDLTTYASAITNLPSGGGDVNPTAEKNDVTFYDYDGTIRYSYTAEEFLTLTEMPPLPTQKGLICQEWNWAFEDAREYVTEYGILDVGATYITDDGKTRLYIRIAEEGRMTVPLYFSQTVAKGVTIDWGDGSATQTLSGTGSKNTTHTYANIGDYCITLTVSSGCTLGLGRNSSSYCVMGSTTDNGSVYCNMLQKVEIGTGVTSIDAYAFYNCYSLSSIVIPSGVTSISYQSFEFCYSLSSVVIPSSVTSIGNSAFTYCYSLSSVVVPTSVTLIENNIFNKCYSLSSIVIPSSVTSISTNVFDACHSLSSIVIPSSVTSIGNSAFTYCYSLSSVVIPSSVTSISTNAFYNCYGMAFYDFSTHTSVPTLSSTSAFKGIPSDCKIIVPDNLYDTWKAATNWSTYSSKIIKKSDWDNK